MVAGHQLRTSTLNGSARISLLFMTLPDGKGSGKGFDSTKHQSLKSLREGSLPIIRNVNGTASYTKQQLADTLLEIMRLDKPTKIDTQQTDNLTDSSDGDHSDHHASGYFAQLAESRYKEASTTNAYSGYPSAARPPNIEDLQAIALKQKIFSIYAQHDPAICPQTSRCNGALNYQKYMSRQYKQ